MIVIRHSKNARLNAEGDTSAITHRCAADTSWSLSCRHREPRRPRANDRATPSRLDHPHVQPWARRVARDFLGSKARGAVTAQAGEQPEGVPPPTQRRFAPITSPRLIMMSVITMGGTSSSRRSARPRPTTRDGRPSSTLGGGDEVESPVQRVRVPQASSVARRG